MTTDEPGASGGRVEVGTAQKGVAVVTLDRPAKLNAMTPSMFDDLGRAIADLDSRPDVRAIVLTGAGRAFCSGADLRSVLATTDARSRSDLVRGVLANFWTLHDCATPVVAAVNGLAFGAGLELLLSCTFVVADPRATFSLPEVRHGIVAEWARQQGPGRIGRSWTDRLMSTGEVVDVSRALDIGLCHVQAAVGAAVPTAIALV